MRGLANPFFAWMVLSIFCKHTFTGLLVIGASDDAVSCAVMLEVLHSLANQSTPIHHGVVFLFNGAEENILQVKWLACQRLS